MYCYSYVQCKQDGFTSLLDIIQLSIFTSHTGLVIFCHLSFPFSVYVCVRKTHKTVGR